jgi:hypothetical protein
VLLSDRDLAGLPSLAQPVQVGDHNSLQHRLDGVDGEEPVEGGVGNLLIQPVECPGEVAGECSALSRQGLQDDLGRLVSEGGTCSL